MRFFFVVVPVRNFCSLAWKFRAALICCEQSCFHNETFVLPMLKQVALWSPLNTEVIYQTFLSFPQPYTSKIPDFQMTSCSERRFFFPFLFWPQQCPSVSITPIRLGLNAFLMLHIITYFPWALHFPLCPLRIISIDSEEHSLYSRDHLLPISPSPSVKRAGDPELYSKVFSKEPCFELLQVCPGCWVPQLFHLMGHRNNCFLI